MDSVYNRLCREAQDEYGHNGYNGTISTTYGALQAVHQPMTGNGASLWGEWHSDDTSKWESALAIPVAADKDFTLKKVKFTFEMPAINVHEPEDEWDRRWERPTTKYDLQEAATRQALKQYGHQIHEIQVVPKVKTKTVVEPAAGRPVTRYAVAGRWGGTKLYATKGEAVRAAKQRLADSGDKIEVQVVKYWPDANTTTAITVRAETVAAQAEVTVTLALPKTARPETVGWVFYGMAAE